MYFSCAFKVKGGEWLRQENNQIVKIKAWDSTVLYKKEKNEDGLLALSFYSYIIERPCKLCQGIQKIFFCWRCQL